MIKPDPTLSSMHFVTMMYTSCGIIILSLMYYIIRKQHGQIKYPIKNITDDILFKQPDSSHTGVCPICLIPLATDGSDYSLSACCSQCICDGCGYANQKREFEARLDPKCPFCRHPVPTSQTEGKNVFWKRLIDRVKMDDPVTIGEIGSDYFNARDYRSAFKYWKMATDLGNVQAHYQLSTMYQLGLGVEKSRKMEIYHLERAAIAGHAPARFNLGSIERENGNTERAVKHFIIAATQGDNKSLVKLMVLYEIGVVTDDDFAATIRAHRGAVDATKSPDRNMAAIHKRKQTIDLGASRSLYRKEVDTNNLFYNGRAIA